MSLLLPDGIDHLADLPWPLFDAIRLALNWLRWLDDLDHDEVPPRAIWLEGEELAEWWKHVRALRKEKYSGKTADEPEEDPGGYTQNPAVRDLIR